MRAVDRRIAAGGALNGQVAVITGAGAGIGRAIAITFARAGAHCILVTLERDEGNAIAGALKTEGRSVDLFIADVGDEHQVNMLEAEIASRQQKIDVLVNNAGVFLEADRQARASSVDDEIIRTTLAVNVYGAIHMSRALAHLIPSGGRILNVSSVMGQPTHRPDGFGVAYRMSKAALNIYTQSLAHDLQSRGIMVDCFHPGWVKTPLGGPGAKIEPHEATATAFFLATRPPSATTGRFWQDCRPVPW